MYLTRFPQSTDSTAATTIPALFHEYQSKTLLERGDKIPQQKPFYVSGLSKQL
jgi:hypothetical protein